MRLLKKEQGSMVLEASLILPLFMSFLLFLIAFIRIATVDIALNHAVSEATKQIAVHIYPASLTFNKFNDTKTGQKTFEYVDLLNEKREQIINAEEIIKEYKNLFPPEIRNIIELREKIESGIIDVYDATLSTAFQPIVDHYADKTVLKLENLQVTKVVLPDLRYKDPAYFGIEVNYYLPLNIPFIHKTITFKKQAYERVWYGDSFLESAAQNKDEKSTDQIISIESISSPVQRGRSVTIIAKGPPNTTATITLFYQSGFVKQKSCSFDSNGWLNCSIRIGGHANQGTYEAVVNADGHEAKGSFEVLSKDNMKKYRENRENLSYRY